MYYRPRSRAETAFVVLFLLILFVPGLLVFAHDAAGEVSRMVRPAPYDN